MDVSALLIRVLRPELARLRVLLGLRVMDRCIRRTFLWDRAMLRVLRLRLVRMLAGMDCAIGLIMARGLLWRIVIVGTLRLM